MSIFTLNPHGRSIIDLSLCLKSYCPCFDITHPTELWYWFIVNHSRKCRIERFWINEVFFFFSDLFYWLERVMNFYVTYKYYECIKLIGLKIFLGIHTLKSSLLQVKYLWSIIFMDSNRIHSQFTYTFRLISHLCCFKDILEEKVNNSPRN